MNTEMRHLQVDEMFGSMLMRSLDETGNFSVPHMRGQGFRALENRLRDPLLDAAMKDAQFRALAPLPEKAQVVLDNAVMKVGLDRLTVVKTLLNAGLTYNLSDPLSVMQIESYSRSKAANAFRSMSPESRDENFIAELLQSRLPIYLTKATFFLDIRTLRMSQRVGMPLDTANIEDATRAVNESVEDAVINGATTLDGADLQVAGYKAPGLVNAPNAATANLTAAAWGGGGTVVPATILAQTQAAIAQLVANKRYGPYAMFVPTNVAAALGNDYTLGGAAPQNTIRERLLKLEGLQSITTADLLPRFTAPGTAVNSVGAKVIIVQLTNDVIDIVVGQKPTVIPWTSASGFTFYNMVMAIMVPRVRSDYNGQSGVFVGTLA